MENTQAKSYLLLIFAMVLWGGAWPVTKVLVSDQNVPPLTIGFFRFLVATLCFLPALFHYKGTSKLDYTRSNYGWFFLLGLLGIFGYGILFLIGLKYTTAAQGSIIAGINPAIISLLAHIFHDERLRKKWMYSGFFLSFLGVGFVIGVQSFIDFNRDHLIGNLIIVCAMVCWSLYSNVGKHVMKEFTSLEATTGAVFFGLIIFAIGSTTEKVWTLQDEIINYKFWLAIIYLGVMTTFLGFELYFRSIRIIGATNSSIFINLVPIFGTLLSFIFLGEQIYWTFIVGLILIVIGIFVINFPIKEEL